MRYIIPPLFYSLLAGWGGYFVYKYKKTSETRYLKGLGNYVLFLTFWGSLLAGSKAVIFPGTTWIVYVILLTGALAGFILKSFHYEGARKFWPGLHVVIFLCFTNFLVLSMNYYRKVILMSYSSSAVSRALPEAAAALHPENLTPGRKAELGARLAGLLSSPDRFTRMGALQRLNYLPETIPAALPAMAASIPTCDEDTLEVLFPMFEKLGPAAAAAVPAITLKMEGLARNSGARYRGEDALKAISVSTAPAASGG